MNHPEALWHKAWSHVKRHHPLAICAHSSGRPMDPHVYVWVNDDPLCNIVIGKGRNFNDAWRDASKNLESAYPSWIVEDHGDFDTGEVS